MGAIAGCLGPEPSAVVPRLAELLSHRGSHLATHAGRNVGMACRAAEPSRVGVARSGRVRCVLDGQLLNSASLREVVTERAGSDADVVARLFAAEGPRAFSKLDGPFAAALYDGESLYLVRDALGEKPLYYAPCVGDTALFATEVKAFLGHTAFRCEPNLDALNRLLVFSFLPGPETAFRGVLELEPGSYVRLRPRQEPEVLRYWEVEEAIDDGDEKDFVERLRGALREAVARRLPPSGEVGAFLSGGVDSSAVVALLAELGRTPICFSAGFGFGEPNELIYARLVAQHCGAEHRVLDVQPETFIDLLPQILWCLDDPLCDCITVPNYLLAREAAREVSVVFNGEGGDPLFGGPKNKFLILGEWYSFLGGYDRAQAYLSSYHKFYDLLDDLCTPEFLEATGGASALEEHVRDHLGSGGMKFFLNRLMHVNVRLKGGQNILVKVDKMLSPNGVTACSPLFDRRLTELSFRIPPPLKRRGDVEKYVFKKAVERLLPAPVVYRKKAGMGVPLNAWFKKMPLKGYARELLTSPRARERGYFRPEIVEGLVAGAPLAARVGRDRMGELVWMLLAIEIWHRVFVDGDLRP